MFVYRRKIAGRLIAVPGVSVARSFLVVAGFFTGLAAAQAQPPTEAASESQQRPNVVIFLIDTLRADRLGIYGYDKPTSPHIDALAPSAVRFSHAESAAPWTLPSIVSLMTSKHPVEHGVVADGRHADPAAPVLAERLQRLDYQTESYYANEFAGSASAMTRGFDHAALVTHTDGNDVRKFLNERDEKRPFFLYIHNVEPHNPFELRVGERYTEHFGEVDFVNRRNMLDLYVNYRGATRKAEGEGAARTKQQTAYLAELQALKSSTIDVLYDASVRLADERVGEVIAALREGGVWENTVFVLLSDHGEEMGEHGGWQHDQSVYAELVHVPFLIRFPRDVRGGQVLASPATLVDVVPTLLDLLGEVPEPGASQGTSLLPIIRGDEGARAAWDERIHFTAQRVNVLKYYQPFKASRGDFNIVMRQGSWKAIWNGEQDVMELYTVSEDPTDSVNLAEKHPALVESFREAVKQRFGGLQLEDFETEKGSWELTPAQIENLKTLGYL